MCERHHSRLISQTRCSSGSFGIACDNGEAATMADNAISKSR